MGKSDLEVSIIAIRLAAKGDPIQLEFHPDGDIVFWREDGTIIEFDRKDADAMRIALRQQAEVMGVLAKASAKPIPSDPEIQPGNQRPVPETGTRHESLSKSHRGLRVAKEGTTWGATVMVDGISVRYHYQFRDQARAARPEHQIGDAGRVE